MSPEELVEYIERVESSLYADIAVIKQMLDKNREVLGKRTFIEMQWFLTRVNEHQDGLERALNNIKKKLGETNK